MVVFASDWIKQIPMAALVAVMIMVSIGTFSWSSIRDIPKLPPSTSLVMLATVAVVVYTHNLALGVLIGVLLSAVFFANKIARFLLVEVEQSSLNSCTYTVIGQVFFASANKFEASFNFKDAQDKVIIDLTRAHFWDITAIAALDKIVMKYQRLGAKVEVMGMTAATKTLVDKFSLQKNGQAVEKLQVE